MYLDKMKGTTYLIVPLNLFGILNYPVLRGSL